MYYIYIYVYICIIHPSVRPSVHPSIHPAIQLSIQPCIHASIRIHLSKQCFISIYRINVSIYPSIHPSIYASIYPFMCPSIHPTDLSLCPSRHPPSPRLYQPVHRFLPPRPGASRGPGPGCPAPASRSAPAPTCPPGTELRSAPGGKGTLFGAGSLFSAATQKKSWKKNWCHWTTEGMRSRGTDLVGAEIGARWL